MTSNQRAIAGMVDPEQLGRETQGRYSFLRILGRGSYGMVFAAQIIATGQLVALKRVERIFESVHDTRRILREIRILSHLRHENITNLLDLCAAPTFAEFQALIIVVDLMDTDMCRVIMENPDLQPDHHRYFIYQILRGLKYVHSASVIHRDLKPGNLLVNSDCDLKIGDFGLARVAQREDEPQYLSEYVTTRWYRAPEVLLSYETYDNSIDIWSVGCIFAELILRRPIFPGPNVLAQLAMMTQTLGTPSEEDLMGCVNQKARDFMASLPHYPKIPFAQLFPGVDPVELDLLERMLAWNPRERPTVEEALSHPFMAKYHDPMDEPVSFPLEDFEFEDPNVTMQDLKVYMWNEVLKYHPEFGTE
jgi:mitogen-activated protein kinase 1/3